MQIQLVRSATIRVSMAGVTLLIDPWLAAKGEGRSYSGDVRSPLVDLPMPAEAVVEAIDAVLISHLHSDHFDTAAAAAIRPGTPVLAPEHDVAGLEGFGLAHVSAITGPTKVGPVEIVLTPGRHGPDEVLEAMGEVAGFLLRAPGEPSVYWVGDSILCDEVRQVIRSERPDVVVVHACGADWEGSAPLVMDAAMVLETMRLSAPATVVATHMDAVDHATVSRADLECAAADLDGPERRRLRIPADGEVLVFPPAAQRPA
ncbi:MBL fold metallo-hydrolase [Brevundimonas sp.]|uniref:MBL fold metallo-hydrolase n=1 Tax=Brevundimonas sp. TaxID=1871086 RepID=UPI002C975384|nr:MBL fold metallo-hydrolase [Brevundimonas sp.]HWQ87186.1 MBL fold metallo-hydrolase [Brevundimonas sp.]